jgi:CHAT domain-containing protein
VAEAAAVANALHTKPLLDSAATKEAVKAGAPDVAYLHLCCHGSFSWLAPMYSAIYLANDEPLRLSEIIGELDLRSARLITLSACETGVSEVRQSPDEYIGLPAGFMQAGAPAVISSLWTVDDRSTALLMERVYRNHIEHHMTCSAALREAQLWLRNATRQELGDYYKSFLRMSASDAFAGFMELSLESGGKPEDRPYANPFYWAAFTFNGASE